MLGVLCAVVGLSLVNGVSIAFPGIILGGPGYYFGLQSSNRSVQILRIVAVVGGPQ